MIDTVKTVSSNYSSIIGVWPFMGYFISALICILLGSILSPIIDPFTNKFYAWINSAIFRKSKKLSGQWTHNWHVVSKRFPPENITKNVTIKQFGNRISAKYIVSDINGKEYTYFIKGIIEDNNFVRGEWFDLFSGKTYNGTFLLSIDVNMDRMEGLWIGTSEESKVKDGKWEWTRE